MFRRHPLLILLLLATVAVNVTLMWQIGFGQPTKRAAFSGLLLGQTGALALWAVWGQGHRLARVSLMVVATGLIAVATGRATDLGQAQWLAVLSMYTFIVYVGSLALAVGQAYAARSRQQEVDGPSWQVSLIELFGWTILVAISSFASRSMSFHFLKTNTFIALKVGLIVLVPLVLAIGVRSSLRELTPNKLYWLFFTASMLVGTIVLRSLEPRTAVPLILGQTGYLLTWLIVLRLDRQTVGADALDGISAGEGTVAEDESGQLDA